MVSRKLSYILLPVLSLSCSVEKINLSPVGAMSAETQSKNSGYSVDQRKNLTVYSSEITNLIASFPKFRSDAVNNEVRNLSYHLKDYVGAVEAYNMVGLYEAERKFEKSYKKLQKLRKFLNKDDDEVLNRYLVRIKTNLGFINDNLAKDSTVLSYH